jgi:ferredoxin-type protein NapH
MKTGLFRRVIQIAALLILIAVPLCNQNSSSWVPFSVTQGNAPDPTISNVFGDTWSFEAGGFQITHPVAFLDCIISSKTFQYGFLLSALIPLFMTLLLGRVFCSWICPVGFILELAAKIRKSYPKKFLIIDFRYRILVAALVLGFIFAIPVISIFDAPHLLGRELMLIFTHQEPNIFGLCFLLLIFLFEIFFVSRSWCRYFCPSGGCLSLLGMHRVVQIAADPSKCNGCNKCRKACPYELYPKEIGSYTKNRRSICDNCGLCKDVCPTDAISFQIKV